MSWDWGFLRKQGLPPKRGEFRASREEFVPLYRAFNKRFVGSLISGLGFLKNDI